MFALFIRAGEETETYYYAASGKLAAILVAGREEDTFRASST